jgi:hypothetical protein
MEILLYDNYDINYTEMFVDFQEWCETNDIDGSQYNDESSEFFEWVNEQMGIDFDDFISNFEYSNENDECVVEGKVGRWNGTFEIEPKNFGTTLSAIMTCIDGCDYNTIKLIDGVIEVVSRHHDGTNVFSIHKLVNNKKEKYSIDIF